jgi:succinate-semialdehyde dehydrogenase / glutarate-semialdehyde dehydrogenase
VAIASVNPATGETLEAFEPHSAAEVERRVHLAAETFSRWRRTSFAERAARVQRAADLLDSRKQEWGRIMTLEMGKPIGAAVAEAEKCAWVCRYYAENAERYLADEAAPTDASQSFVRYEPLGPVLAVMPWNFPFWQVFRFAVPALMAGNVGLLKHASNVPQCALAIETVFREAGVPNGAFQTLLVGSDRVAALIDDPRIAAVTLTGSEAAGVSVGRAAGAQIKKAVLELGGSDPFIVMPSADLAVASSTAVKARTINNGQSCIAAKRFIVHQEIAAEFERLFVEKMSALKVGDPLDPSVQVGPLATPAILDEVDDLVRRTIAAGAKLLLGGKRLDRSGSFYAPTVLSGQPGGGRGDLRARREPFPGQERGRCHRPRQRDALWPRRIGLDPRRSRARAPHPRHRRRRRLHQRHGQERPPPALRRHQALRLRPRALHPGHPRIRQRQSRLDRLGGQVSQSVNLKPAIAGGPGNSRSHFERPDPIARTGESSSPRSGRSGP